MIQAGAIAPDFVLPAHTGIDLRLYDVLDESDAVVFFYSRDATPG